MNSRSSNDTQKIYWSSRRRRILSEIIFMCVFNAAAHMRSYPIEPDSNVPIGCAMGRKCFSLVSQTYYILVYCRNGIWIFRMQNENLHEREN